MKKTLLTFLAIFLPLFSNHAVEAPEKGYEQTLSIIKPDAVKDNLIGPILSRFEQSGLRVAAIKMVELTKPQAMEFYLEHKGKPFYFDLTNYMSSGPIVVFVLEGANAIQKSRDLIGATDPAQAKPGTIRRDFARSKTSNAVHGSDSPESAEREIKFFFKPQDLFLKSSKG